MNYYEHHLGDYAAATAHLSWDEDMAYTRLIRAYYHHEKPIPADLKAACRLARAATPSQRKAVEDVLLEFFVLEDDGWHQKRCDSEIDAYRASEPDRDAKKANETVRLRRHREERATLFSVLNANGQHAAWNVPMSELRAMVKRIEAQGAATPPATEPATPPATNATATATATHTQTHTPDTRPKEREERAQGSPPVLPAAAICRALLVAGIPGVQSQHPLLLALVEAGATETEFLDAVPASTGKRDAFAYLLSVVKGRREDAAREAAEMVRGGFSAPPKRQPDRKERQLAVAAVMTGAATEASRNPPPETIDVESRVIAP